MPISVYLRIVLSTSIYFGLIYFFQKDNIFWIIKQFKTKNAI